MMLVLSRDGTHAITIEATSDLITIMAQKTMDELDGMRSYGSLLASY